MYLDDAETSPTFAVPDAAVNRELGFIPLAIRYKSLECFD